MYQHLNNPPQPLSVRNPAISTAIDAVILRALSKKPEDRYPSVIAFAQAFQNALQSGQDIRITLAVSEKEALNGTTFALMLSGGREVTIPVPAGARDGQELRFDGKGSPSPHGGPAGALTITLSILQMNGHIRVPSIQSITQPLHLSEDIAVLVENARGNQMIVNHLNNLSQSTLALQASSNSSEQMIAQRLQSLLDILTDVQVNPKSDPAVIKQLDDITKSIRTLQSSSKSDSSVIKQLDDLVQTMANLQSNLKGDPAFTKELSKLSSTITTLQTDNTKDRQTVIEKLKDLSAQVDSIVKSNPASIQKRSTRRISGNLIALLVGIILLILVNSIGLFNVYQANRALSMIQATSHTFTAPGTVAESFDPYPPYSGNLVLYAPFNQADPTWNNGSNSSGGCQFSNETYDITQLKLGEYNVCRNSTSGLSNITFEVQMKIIKGDCGGIDFYDNVNGKAYLYTVCQNGTYSLNRYAGTTLASGTTVAIHTGLNQFNLIAIVANGGKIDLYVNYQRIASANDSNYSSQGYIGLTAVPQKKATEVLYTYAKVWELAGGQLGPSSPTTTSTLGGS